MKDPTSPRKQPESPQNGGVRSGLGWTLTITNLTKLVGVGLAINELAVREHPRNLAGMIIAICILGVQVVENVLLRTIDRLFGNGSSR